MNTTTQAHVWKWSFIISIWRNVQIIIETKHTRFKGVMNKL